MWVDIIQSVEDLNRTKRQSKGEFAIHIYVCNWFFLSGDYIYIIYILIYIYKYVFPLWRTLTYTSPKLQISM